MARRSQSHTKHQACQYEASLAAYRRAIEIRPDFFEAHINLAAASKAIGQLDAAITSYRRVLAIGPNLAETHCHLGEVLRKTGRIADALESYRKAIDIEPTHAPAHRLLGSAFRHVGRLPEAAASYRQALEITSDSADTHNDLGVVLRDLGQLDEAVASYAQALKIKPDFAEVHNNLGVALRDLGQFENAVASCRRAVALKPTLYEAYSNLGNGLQDVGQFDAAASSYRRAIEIQPNFAEAHNNLGVCLKTQGELDLALESFLKAISLDKNAADAHCNVGVTLQEQGKIDECIQYFERALALSPNRDATRYAFGLMHLQIGNLKDGWAGYEYRWTGSDKPVKKPEWQGEPLEGKTILIWGEQGVGDEIMFAGLFGEVAAHAKRCIVACTAKLIPLFSESFSDIEFVSLADLHGTGLLNEIDFQCPSGSLARWMRTDQNSFCTQGIYIKPKAERVAYWKNRLNAIGPGLKIGICWRSAYISGNRYLHYSSLDQWGPVFAVQGVHFFSLQCDHCDAELQAARLRFKVPIHDFVEVDLYNDLAEAAALTAAMDLVIGATTASGRLAAALGVQMWAIRYGIADCTSLGTDHTPWLPCIQFFSRTWDQGWAGVIENITSRLTLRVDELAR